MTAPLGPRTVTAVVVGFNHANCLGRCFDSLFGSTGIDALQVVYVDNSSEDSSVACTSWHPEIEVVRNPENLGFAHAVNQGIYQARHAHVALVNPDTALGPDCLARLVDHLEHHPGTGLVGPTLLDEEGRPQVSLAPYPTIRGLAGRWLGREPDPDRAWLVGAMVMGRAHLLRELRGLDELFFVYGEDMDLSHRVQERGLAVTLLPDLHITHTGNPRWNPERLVRGYGAYMRFAGKHRGPRQRIPLGLLLSWLWLLRGGLASQGPTTLVDGLRRIWSMERDRAPESRFY